MGKISERDFVRIVDGVVEDCESICRHNPIGTEEETLLWMVMSCLINFLGLSDNEIPCFPGGSTSSTYRQAIEFIAREYGETAFDAATHLDKIRRGSTE